MADDFEGHNRSIIGPCPNLLPLTASPSPLAKTTTALYITTAGTITATLAGNGSQTFPVAVGLLPIRVTHVTAISGAVVAALW